MNPSAKGPRLFLTALLTALMLLTSLYCWAAIPARAESQPPIPEPGTDFFYNDQANLLSAETKALILTKNAGLSQYSVQLAVLTMDTLPVTGYTQRVEYLRAVMQSWQLGGAEGRGLLLALSVSDGDYIAAAGDGLQSHFTTDLLKSLLDAQLEPDFSAGSYDLLWVAIAAGAVAVICIAVFILSGRPGRRRYGRRRGVHRHTPLVTPPRTTVLHRESHTPMIVKSARRGDGPTRVKKL